MKRGTMMAYTFSKPETDEDYEALYQVMDAVFGDEDVRSITRRFVEHHPEMNKEHFFLVKHEDKAVAGLVLVPQVWKLGEIELKVAEMGCVGTNPEHRRKGVQRILNNEFDKYAKENGFDLCALAGIPYFYRQFGYQYAVELDYSTELKVEELPERDTGIKAEKFEESHINVADEILRKTQERYHVRSKRTRGIWEMQQTTGTYGGEPYEADVFTRRGEIAGYYRYVVDDEKKTINIKELGISENVSAEEIAAAIRKQASEKGLTELKTGLSHMDEFSKYLISMGAKKNRPYAWQVKIIDLPGLISKIKPVLEQRVENSEYTGLSKDLTINFWKYAVKMKIEEGKIVSMEKVFKEEDRTIGFNPYVFIKLALGYKSRIELEKMYPDFRVQGDLGGLIDVMFPKQPSYIHYSY
jgi:predicted acetyltransferase